MVLIIDVFISPPPPPPHSLSLKSTKTDFKTIKNKTHWQWAWDFCSVLDTSLQGRQPWPLGEGSGTPLSHAGLGVCALGGSQAVCVIAVCMMCV